MEVAETRHWLRPFLTSLAPVFREVLVMSLFINLMALAVPVFVLQVYDRVVFHAGLETLTGLVAGMAVVLVFDFVLRQSRARMLQRVAARADVAVGRRLFDKLLSLPLPALERRPAASWHALFRDIDTIRATVSGASAALVVDLPFALLFLGLIYVIAPSIAWVLLVALPVFLLLAWRSGQVLTRASLAEREAGLGRDRLLAELIAGRSTVKALSLGTAMRPRWEDRHADAIERAISRGAAADGYTNLATSLTMLTTVALTAVGAVAILDQALTIGALIAANILAGRLLGPLTQLVGMWRTYAGFAEAGRRLGEVFALAGERTAAVVDLPWPAGRLTLEEVTYGYESPDRPVIDRISHRFDGPGVHALVGPNGSGKTTLLKLFQGLYRPQQGRVLLDGGDLGQFSRDQLAGWIGYVAQDCVLFAGSIRDNLAVRRPEADDAAILAAARSAGAHAFIVDLPDGYASDVGEMGQRLSAGQRQRIAIARALLGDPPVLLFDEPSSNLDRDAETELRRRLDELGRDRLVIVVTHSPVLLGACSRMVVLDGGRIALAGPTAEVLPRLTRKPAPKPTTAAAVVTLSTGTGPAEPPATAGPVNKDHGP